MRRITAALAALAVALGVTVAVAPAAHAVASAELYEIACTIRPSGDFWDVTMHYKVRGEGWTEDTRVSIDGTTFIAVHQGSTSTPRIHLMRDEALLSGGPGNPNKPTSFDIDLTAETAVLTRNGEPGSVETLEVTITFTGNRGTVRAAAARNQTTSCVRG